MLIIPNYNTFGSRRVNSGGGGLETKFVIEVTIDDTDSSGDRDFDFRSQGPIGLQNYNIDWGDGNSDTGITTINKVHTYDNSKVTDSISFSGSSFSEESLNLVLSIKISNDGLIDEFNLSIDINKPPAEDMFYLWGGMTVFWASIGAYVLYISSRLTQLRDK